MLSTTILVALVLGQLLLTVVLWALFLRLGLRWGKVKPENITRKKLFAATAIAFLLQCVLGVLFAFVIPIGDTPQLQWGILIAESAFSVAVTCVVIARIFKAKPWQSIVAWLATLLPVVAMVAFSLGVVRPFLFEPFTNPTLSMAPTLLGPHVADVCPVCGQPAYRPPHDERRNAGPEELNDAVCEDFHNSEVPDVAGEVQPADQFLVAKFVSPQRWDLVTFRVPESPDVLWVSRIVGLPGETITIEDGAVFANGERLDVPEDLAGISYASEDRHPRAHLQPPLWGSVDAPAELGDDEYFVLGDFTNRSNDSRYWITGAEGHAPYAVPASHLQGVVTHIYWPLSRWRVFK